MLTTPRLLALLLTLVLAACAERPKDLVVLLDSGGGPSQVIVRNAAGEQILQEAGAATGFDARNQRPREPFRVEGAELQQLFGQALAAQPEPPVRFVLNFVHDSTDLVAESKQRLPDILRTIAARKAPDVGIVGHADATGEAAYNEALAQRRAEAVRREVVGIGVDARLIEVGSHGDRNPLVPVPRGVAEPRNRRVEVTVR